MRSRIAWGAGAVLASVLLSAVAFAQSDGAALYEEKCTACHKSQGEGLPPTFPALAGNPDLGTLSVIVDNIHKGKGNMPPFPDLTAEQIAAIASHIRTSWGNDFGVVTTDEVEAILSGLPAASEDAATEPAAEEPAAEETAEQPATEEPATEQPAATAAATIWDGVFTEEQAARGELAYKACTKCHGSRLNGAPDDPDRNSSPALARVPFLREWTGRDLGVLFAMTKSTMPQSNPGYLSDQEYVDIIAYMLQVSQAPAGDTELSTDPTALSQITIQPKPE